MSSKRAKKRPLTDESDKASSNVANELENDSMKENNIKLLDIQKMRALIAELDVNYITQKKELEIHKSQINSLCRSTGIYCVKFSSTEFVFDIVIAENGKLVETYNVQIFNENDKGVLGRLKIPLGLDIQRILFETPLDHLLNTSKFLKNCKHYIDLFHERKKQFEEFKSYIANAINCFIDTNYNYTIMYLQIMKVHNSETDKYCNLIVYLLYDLADEKPNTIKIDSSNNEEELDVTTHTYLKSSLKCFKTSKLKEALINFEDQNNTPIVWKKKLSDDSLLSSDSIDSSDSEPEDRSTLNRKSKQSKKPVKTTSKSKAKRRKSTRKTSMEDSFTSITRGKFTLTSKTKSSRRILVRNKHTTKKQNDTLKQSKLNFVVKKNNKVEKNRETSSSEPSDGSTNHINTNVQNEELESGISTANENNAQSAEIDKEVQSEKTKRNKENAVIESNDKSSKNENNNQNKELESKEKTIENETCKQIETPESLETIKNIDGKSNFLPHGKKLDHQTVSTSTPLMQKSKSILKQAMREDLDVSDITRVEGILPNIPES